ncbi:uncharacterized protein RHOBADRAFT_41358 [Rhodotorula graminis WP1]|uniref:Protein kinase domain-containing protein n=1 Tax=Rhodotorula graminis (strain WP1) TaxID=578459 RepID=A0A194SA77_RHOGW|nr:uncharacterized protein RHOBADRAFT_41358 [Rhodotorula graminis WP1]KPV77365.1 hypothetical protein RHOBADRAFT_41358 [Rhodotorula graminis WP1]
MSFLPPGDEIFEPNERARAALAEPLQSGHLLRPTGPALRLDLLSRAGASGAVSTGIDDVPQHFQSPNPLRPANLALLDAASTRTGWQGIALRLDTPAWVGHAKYTQVWHADVDVEGRTSGRAVVKLFADALWPLPHVWIEAWRPLEQRIESELQAYASLRPTQGRDVPHCYGAYTFEMPWGDVVTGVVLEDLSDIAEPFAVFCEREKEGTLLDIESAYATISASFHCLHRLHALDVGRVRPCAANIYVLRSSTASTPHLVFAGFSGTASDEEGRRLYAAEEPESVYRWGDESLLENVWWIGVEYRLDWCEELERREPGLVAWNGQREPGLIEDMREDRARALC